MQLDFSKLMDIRLKQAKGIVQSKYDTLSEQIVWKDLSFVINKVDSYDKIVDIVKKINEIDDVKVFDIYAGENLPDDKKSISISIKIK
jgi:phenylalanyl-tRNA synthetase beta chain